MKHILIAILITFTTSLSYATAVDEDPFTTWNVRNAEINADWYTLEIQSLNLKHKYTLSIQCNSNDGQYAFALLKPKSSTYVDSLAIQINEEPAIFAPSSTAFELLLPELQKANTITIRTDKYSSGQMGYAKGDWQYPQFNLLTFNDGYEELIKQCNPPHYGFK